MNRIEFIENECRQMENNREADEAACEYGLDIELPICTPPDTMTENTMYYPLTETEFLQDYIMDGKSCDIEAIELLDVNDESQTVNVYFKGDDNRIDTIYVELTFSQNTIYDYFEIVELLL